jgi:hypothetical protein
MTVFVNDTFTDASGTALSSHAGELGATWTRNTFYPTGSMVISDAGRARKSNTANALYYAGGIPAVADYDVEADLVQRSDADAQAGIVGRYSTTQDQGYLWLHINVGTPGWQLFKAVAGTFTQLGASINHTLTTDQAYRARLEMRGVTIKGYVDGVEQISASDSSVTSAGRAGMRANNITATNTTNYHLDNFTATDTVVAGALDERHFPRGSCRGVMRGMA